MAWLKFLFEPAHIVSVRHSSFSPAIAMRYVGLPKNVSPSVTYFTEVRVPRSED